MVDTFRAARTTALRAGPVCLGACSGRGDATSERTDRFSFFVTTMAGLLELAAHEQGFGSYLSYNGKSGVFGADELRVALAERAMTGDDLPNEDGLPNHLDAGPECRADRTCRDKHDILTGSDDQGRLVPGTCEGWTSLTAPSQPVLGHSWPAQSGHGWLRAHLAGGCGRGVKVEQAGAPIPGDRTVGAGGGYGGFYRFASTP